MKDIRINKNKIKLNNIKLLFYKINFKFFSRILNKYKSNDGVDFLISQKIPLTFFVKSSDNESILKSISEIIDILNKKDKEHSEKESSIDGKDSQSIISINKEFASYSHSNFDNTYESPSLIYKYNSKNNKIVQSLESVVDKMRENIKLSKKKNKEESLKEKEIKTSLYSKKHKIESNKTNILEKNIKNEKNIVKENISLDKKIGSKNIKEDTENLIVETFKKRKIESENIKKITSKFKKINEDIIRKNINSIKINKINYDFISNNKKINKNIHDKINKVLSSIIDKNNKIRYFSEFSKNIVIINKKIKSNNILNKLDEFIRKRNLKYNINHLLNKYKKREEKENIEKIHYYSKTADYKSLFDSISYFNSFISKNNFSHITSENLLDFKKDKILKSSKSFKYSSDFFSFKNKKINFGSLKKENYFNKIIPKYLNSCFKLNSNNFQFQKDNIFSFEEKNNFILDSVKNNNKKIRENNLENYVYSNKNIVYRNKVDIKKIIDNSIERIVDTKIQKKTKESPKFFNKNEKVSKIFQNSQKKEQPKDSPDYITKKEIDQIIQSYIESINFQRISERAVESVENKIRIERYRNGLI